MPVLIQKKRKQVTVMLFVILRPFGRLRINSAEKSAFKLRNAGTKADPSLALRMTYLEYRTVVSAVC
jgi:hypothetical protein